LDINKEKNGKFVYISDKDIRRIKKARQESEGMEEESTEDSSEKKPRPRIVKGLRELQGQLRQQIDKPEMEEERDLTIKKNEPPKKTKSKLIIVKKIRELQKQLDKSEQDHEFFKNEIRMKNQQISDLHKNLDQQQQLALKDKQQIEYLTQKFEQLPLFTQRELR